MKLTKVGKKPGEFELVEIGETFGPMNYLIDDHAIKTYAFTQDDYHPWYFTDDTPFGGRIAHPSLLANDLVGTFLEAYDPSKIVGLHTQEELWFSSPAKANENVTVTGKYVDKYVKRGKGYVVLEAEARGEDGRLILKHRGIEIMKIHGDSLGGERASVAEQERVTGEVDPGFEPAKKVFREIMVGTPVTPLEKQTTTEQTQVFSRVGEHFVNIHNNLSLARESGYAGLVVQGIQQVGYLTELLTGFFGASWCTDGHLKVKMVKPVLAGEKLSFSGVVKRKEELDGNLKTYLDVWGKNEDGDMTILGWADCLVKEWE